MSEDRRLAAIMFTDIVGYTALMGMDSNKAMEVVRQSVSLQKPLVEKHHGRWIKEMGDGVLAVFNSTLDAVNCALEIQRASRADFEADIRIGIHLGDITIENDDVYGNGVNIASRLESIADPGGIYISESVEKAIRGQTKVQAKYLGETKLKNVDYDVRVYALQGVGLPIPATQKEKELSGRIWAEVKRRGVIQAGITYMVISLLILLLFPHMSSIVILPSWASDLLISVTVAGFPVALFLAWRYERSPEGFVRTTSKESWQNPYPISQRKPLTGTYIIAGLVLVILFIYLYPRIISDERNQQSTVTSLDSTVTDISIAVLPFINDSPDKNSEYLGNGIMDELITNLQEIEAFRVIPRTSVEIYRNSNKNLKEIGNELKVSYIISGSVRKEGDNLRINTELIDVNKGDILFREPYDGKYSDEIFIFQSNIAKQVASYLNTLISPEKKEKIEHKPTGNIEAYDLYLRGWDMIEKWDSDNDTVYLKTAINLFERALNLDPGYLDAIGGKAIGFQRLGKVDSAIFYSEKLIELNPEAWEPYHILGVLYMFWSVQPEKARYYLDKSLKMAPDNIWVYFALGQYHLIIRNDVIEALRYFQKAYFLSGNENSTISLNLGYVYLNMGEYYLAERYIAESYNRNQECIKISDFFMLNAAQGKMEEALHSLDSICKLNVCLQECNADKFNAYYVMKEYQLAEEYYSLAFNKLGDTRFHFSKPYLDDISIAGLYYYTGRKEKAITLLNDILKQEENFQENDSSYQVSEFLNYLRFSATFSLLENKEKALEYLSKIEKYGFKYGWHDFIDYYPPFDYIRNKSEFKVIMKRAREKNAALRAQIKEMEERGELNL